MKKIIPAPVITIMADNLGSFESSDGIDKLFHHVGAPGNPPEGSKKTKTETWLRKINKESNEPLSMFGKLIECSMEFLPQDDVASGYGGRGNLTPKKDFKEKLTLILKQHNLRYHSGGRISDGMSTPSKSLQKFIKGKDFPAIELEFDRALENVDSKPKDAISAASNILESTFKVYITDEKLVMPKTQTLQKLWDVVKKDLGFNPGCIEDDDLKKILSGIFSIVGGVGALRTHASSAHGQGSKVYKIKPRHARLAIHSAHTLVLFVLEAWDEKKTKKQG